MSDNSAKMRRRSGSPYLHEDDLWLLLHVDVGTAVTGLSVNRFCEKYPFRGSDGEWFHRLTLKRRYYQRKALLKPANLPGDVAVPSPIAEALGRFMDDVRSVFAPG